MEAKDPQKNEKDPKPYHYKRSRPYVAVDCVLIAYDKKEKTLKVFLESRGDTENNWALPGRFMHCSDSTDTDNEWTGGETIDETLRLLLTKEYIFEYKRPDGVTQTEGKQLFKEIPEHFFCEQLAVRSAIDRDRGRKDKNGNELKYRVISIPHLSLLPYNEFGHDNDKYFGWSWTPLKQVLLDNDPSYSGSAESEGKFRLAFDHSEILISALNRLRELARIRPLGREIFTDTDTFTIAELQYLYETILNQKLERSNFRKTMIDRGHIKAVGKEENSPSRPADLFTFVDEVYDKMVEDKSFGFNPKMKQATDSNESN